MASNKNKPNLSKFHQQELPACTPVVTVRTAYPYCIAIGCIFIILGGWFLSVSQNITEYVIPYTHCNSSDGTLCSEMVKQNSTYLNYKTCPCQVTVTLQQAMAGPVYMYYGLTNFYQNHRRYVRSRDDNQLNGQNVMPPSSDCQPYQYANISGTLKPINPCGAVAMSLFNDTFSMVYKGTTAGSQDMVVPLSMSNIAWPSDRQIKFGRITREMYKSYVKPDSWPKDPLDRNTDSYSGDEALIVWMRTAALPNFRKLYAYLDQSSTVFQNGLPAGTYVININYCYPVTQFSGTKRIILTQSSWLGGKNNTLGITYIVVGIIHLLLGVIFLIVDLHLIKRRRMR